MIFGELKRHEYEISLARRYKMFMFGDFGDEQEDYDWIDMAVFSAFTFITLILFTNILIAYMGEAHSKVLETMEICQGQGTTELLIELETLFR